MPYTIGTIIYGVEVKGRKLKKILHRFYGELDYQNVEYEKAGFRIRYNGSDSDFLHFGVELGEIDETKAVRIRKLPKVTAQTRDLYEQMFEKLPPEVQAVMPEPAWLIVWSSS